MLPAFAPIAVTMQPSNSLSPLISLRLLVAYLGERKQFAWWDTSFLDATGRGFLARPFPRTPVHAAVRSASDAAGRVHDQAIGRVGIFHLFRLPLDLEQSLDLRLASVSAEELIGVIPSQSDALAQLAALAAKPAAPLAGPQKMGHDRQLGTPASLAQLAAAYGAAFQAGAPVFPYFVKEMETND
jgi:hypothetical protein